LPGATRQSNFSESLLPSLLDTHAEPGLKSEYVKRFTFEYRRSG